jgi:hypothetical protein
VNFLRWKPARPLGTGAFFDFVAFTANREVSKLKSCRIDRRRVRRQEEAAEAEEAKALGPAA